MKFDTVTKALLVLLVVGVWGILLRPVLKPIIAEAQTQDAPRSATFDEITVHRINVVEPDGKQRMVDFERCAHAPPIINGKAYTRSISPGGVVFYNGKGEECGGLALAESKSGEAGKIIFDYTKSPTDGVGIGKVETADGKIWRAGLTIADRRPMAKSVTSSEGVTRVDLADETQDAHLAISDPKGKTRINIAVNSKGDPIIEILDAKGKVVWKAPN
jgi:hypothetical protein